jgi:hypothetical protein
MTTAAPVRPTRQLTESQVAAIREAASGGVAIADLATIYGVTARQAADARDGRIKGYPDVFTPACMTPEELAEWSGGRRWMTAAGASKTSGRRPLTACDDCMPLHALEMRAQGRCNGHPGGAESDEDELDVPARPALMPEHRRPRHMATATATITAPCSSCAHERICVRKPRLASLGRAIEAQLPASIEGISLTLSATVDCDAYMHLRKSPTPRANGQDGTEEAAAPAKSGGVWTPERRARQSELMRGKNNLAGFNSVRMLGNVSGEPIVQLEAAESGS